MTSPLRVGILGSGFAARTHAHAIAHGCKNVVLNGIAGGTRAERLAADFQTPLFPDPNALASSRSIDAVIIATPQMLHHEHALLAAGRGKHILLEKPMATTVEGCREIIDSCAAAGTMLMVAFTQRYRESNRRGYELLRLGKLGRLLSIQDYALVPEGLKAYPQWQQRPESMGILLGYGVHNIDRLRWFLDDEPASVEARVLRSPTGIETTTMALLQWKKGAFASLWSSVDLPLPGFKSTAFRCLVVAEKGLLDVDGYGEVKMAPAGGQWETLFVQPPIDWQGGGMFSEARMGAFIAQDQAFIDGVLSGTPPPVSGMDGLRAVAIALAAYESAATENPVFLPSF